jgi:type IV pilus assembly protein PilO
MTFTDDFAPIDGVEEFDEGPSYPVAFGIELTPKVQGIALALFGIVGAFVLYNRVVQPVAQNKADLEITVADKQAQLEAQENSLAEQEAVQAELDNVIQQRVGIYSLLGSPESLDTLLLDINQQIKASNAGLDQLLAGRLSNSVQTLKLLGATDPFIRAAYTAELRQFNPSGLSGLVTDNAYGEQLNNKLERQVVRVVFISLFDQSQAILRNVERLEPLVVIRDFNQTWAVAGEGIPDEALQRVVRPVTTSFNLEVLVPVGDPTQIPEPPPPPPAEGEGAEGEAPPPPEEG